MLSIAEVGSEFTVLTQQYRALVEQLLSALPLKAQVQALNATDNIYQEGAQPNFIYRLKEGLLTARHNGKPLLVMEPGDLLLPDIAGQEDLCAAITYEASSPVQLEGYPLLDFVSTVLGSPQSSRLWTRLLISQQAVLLRLIASLAELEVKATPGFASFDVGEVIIAQGDVADAVFSLTEGAAQVEVDGVEVGEVKEGEIFGAMAVLTNSPRTATVRARTRCFVVKVPRDQFATLIRTNPHTIQSLLTDMAASISKLNEKLVQATGGRSGPTVTL